jgi:hypothetical protein
MSPYLTIFDGEKELDGVEVGTYADFNVFRSAVVRRLERRGAGSKFPTLIFHSDCDGQWTPQEAAVLEKELVEISARFRELPAEPLKAEWQGSIAEKQQLEINSLHDCFFDVDGEALLERMIDLCRLSQMRGLPILFQ